MNKKSYMLAGATTGGAFVLAFLVMWAVGMLDKPVNLTFSAAGADRLLAVAFNLSSAEMKCIREKSDDAKAAKTNPLK